MVSIFIREDSEFYYLRVYNKLAQDEREKRLKIKTNVPVSKADRDRYLKAKKLRASGQNVKAHYSGTTELNKKILKIKESFFDLELESKLGTKIKKRLKLSEGLQEYIALRSRKGDKKRIAPGTIKSYERAVNIFIAATGSDKEIYRYHNDPDYSKLLEYMEDSDFAELTRASLTKTLASLWNYFISQEYHSEQIIEIYEAEKENAPRDIPLDEFKIILKYYEDQPDRWEWVYYLLLSMCRVSSAAEQLRSDINFKQKYVRMINVKGRRKKSSHQIFPLYAEYEKLIRRIMKRPVEDDSDRLFSHFKLLKDKYSQAFQWWYADQKKLFAAKLITNKYTMHDIRRTFPSYAINELGMSRKDVQYLLGHTDESVAKTFYINEKMNIIIENFDNKPILEVPAVDLQTEDSKLSDQQIQLKIDEIKINRYAPKGLKITKAKLIKLLKEKPVTKIAEEHGVSDSAVHKLIKKYGIDRKLL